MVDTINFIIRDIRELNFKHICQLTQNGLKKYASKNKKTGYINWCYSFNYNEIAFKYNSNKRLITIITNTHKILNKQDTTLSDLPIYKSRVKEIVSEVLKTNDFKLELSRIDYYVDLKIDKNKMRLYLFLLYLNKFKYKNMTIKEKYATSIHLNNKHGKTNLNIYDRQPKTKQDDDEGIFRIEVQCKRRLIKTEYEKYGIEKDIDNYWSIEAMRCI